MPKTPTNELFHLITSLTPGEKRYFKLYFAPDGKNMLYQKLFDCICDMPVYSEDIILLKIPGLKKEQLSNQKKYLFSLILESLVSYKRNNSVDTDIRNGISELEILYNKKLYKSCHKHIRSLKKLTIKYEKFIYELILTRWENTLNLTELNIPKIKERIDSKVDNEKKLLRIYENFLEYDKLISRVIYSEYKFGYERNREIAAELKKLLDMELLRNENKAMSDKAKRIIYQIKSTYYYVIQKYDTSAKYLIKVIQGLEPELQHSESIYPGYITQTKNVMIIYMQTGNRKAFEEAAEKLKSLNKKYRIAGNEDIKIKTNETLLSLQLNFYMKEKDISKAADIAVDAINFINRYELKILKLVLLEFYALLTAFYFIKKEFGESQKWNNRILNFQGISLKQNELTFARIMDLMLNYELGNYFLIESRIRSTARFLKKINEFSQLESLLLNLFRDLLHTIETKEQKEVFGIYLSKLKKMKLDRTDLEITNDLNLKVWLSEKSR